MDRDLSLWRPAQIIPITAPLGRDRAKRERPGPRRPSTVPAPAHRLAASGGRRHIWQTACSGQVDPARSRNPRALASCFGLPEKRREGQMPTPPQAQVLGVRPAAGR
jgi:hypothetical protein